MWPHHIILEVSLEGLWALSFGLSQLIGHSSWLMCEVAQRHEYDNCQPGICFIIVIADANLSFDLKKIFFKKKKTAYNLRLNNVLVTHDSMWPFYFKLIFLSTRTMVTKFLVGSSQHGRLD